ncbi:hypothetical protein ACI6Q2_14405 [Chitinophagaceae bacterium LWZ2-11]
MIELITNKASSSTHLQTIKKVLHHAEEVYMSVAFLKMSGINQLLPYFKKSIQFKIIAGANFGITDPDALSLLLDYSSKMNLKGYLNTLSSKIIFHPKMYLIKSGQVGHILIGSANLTSGGLDTNNECSLYYQCNVTEDIWINVLNYFNNLILPENADLLNDRIISIYRKYHKSQKKINEQSQQFPNMDDNLLYDLNKFKIYFKELDQRTISKDFKEKNILMIRLGKF